ncbi:MAG: DAK2 domain-containing protein [Clostridia bacterium]|nr:DAK2 domain-containing protein [Clostridia bacterium]
MTTTISGKQYQNLIDYGIRNLTIYCNKVNELNVFPVPDGDTGTNMVKTLQNGFRAIQGVPGDLKDLSQKFSKAVVFGARGNSGVITAQFFKGFSECLFEKTEADLQQIASALQSGVQTAYQSVAHPVEGTMLTVLREASDSVQKNLSAGNITTVEELIALFLQQAKRSLDNTPNLLPVLKSAGVVDSGGAGIVYLFEGMEKCLNNQPIEAPVSQNEEAAVDYSRFDRSSAFEYGYCTEFLLQLTNGKAPVNREEFKQEILSLGDSVVTVFDEDKIKVHVHTKAPASVLSYAHKFGEFLTLKIENMSVQHTENPAGIEIWGSGEYGDFAVIAVAHDQKMKELFQSMGADAVIAGDAKIQPSTKDFLKAFALTGAKEIFVFPNSKNSNLAAEKAGEFYPDGNVTVFDTKSVAECYAALSMMDFEAPDKALLADEIRSIIQNVATVLITKAAKSSVFNETQIEKDDFLALSGTELLGVAKERIAVAVRTLETVLRDSDRDTVTLFAGNSVPEEELDSISAYVEKHHPLTDLDVISTGNNTFDLLISFE